MKTRAPELRALIIILASAGPVISTRRSSKSAGAGATVQSLARTSRVPGRKSGRSPASRAAWRSTPALEQVDRACGPNRRCRSATKASASSVRTRSEPGTVGPVTTTPGAAITNLAAADGRLDQAVRLGRGHVDLPVVGHPERREVGRPVVQVRQDHPDLVEFLVPFEHRLGHDPDRRLDAGAVVVGEDLEQGVADGPPGRVEVEVGRAIAPDRRDLRGHEPVLGLGEGRVAVAREAAECRPGGLHDDEVLDAGLDDDRIASGDHGRDARPLTAPDEGVGRGRAVHVDRGARRARGR